MGSQNKSRLPFPLSIEVFSRRFFMSYQSHSSYNHGIIRSRSWIIRLINQSVTQRRFISLSLLFSGWIKIALSPSSPLRVLCISRPYVIIAYYSWQMTSRPAL